MKNSKSKLDNMCSKQGKGLIGETLTKTKRTSATDDQIKMQGQYFTPDHIADDMVSMISKHKQSSVLEPSAGRGVFLKALDSRGFKNLCAVEIDASLKNESTHRIIYKDFLKWNAPQKYDVIIGNPPYIRWKNMHQEMKDSMKSIELCNSLMDILHAFILKSLRLLADGGEMIFITPDYWFMTHHANTLRKKLLECGSFEQIKMYKESRVFQGVTSSIMIFKFIKNVKLSKIIITDIENNKQFKHDQFENHDNWGVIPPKDRKTIDRIEVSCHGSILGDLVDIGNGMVSGRDKAFKLDKSTKLTKKEKEKTIKVIKAFSMKKYTFDEHTNYIFLQNNDEIEKYPNFYKQLLHFKDDLENRYDYDNDTKWFEWSFLRNFKLMRDSNEKIIVPCKERINKKQFIRFAYARGNYFTSQDVATIVKRKNVKESVKYLLGILNSDVIFKWVENLGVLRGGVAEFSEKPLERIPIKRIDWNNRKEKYLHDEIVYEVDDILKNNTGDYSKVNDLVNRLYGIDHIRN